MVRRTKEEHLSLCGCSDCPFKSGEQTRLAKALIEHGIMPVDLKVTGMQIGEGDARVVFIGMAPAKDEVQAGQPFVGKSGKLLRSTIEQLGYTNYYLTNCLFCEIPADATPTDTNKALFCCSQRLDAEVADLKPELIIALGNMPLESMVVHSRKITEAAGHVIDGRLGKVLPVVHPAMVLRSPDSFTDFVDQLEQGIRYLNKSYQVASEPEVVIINDDNFADALNKLDKHEKLVLDIETTRGGLHPYNMVPDGIRCIVIAPDPSIAYIFPGESSPYYEPHPDFTARQELKDMLKGKLLITHNGQFDIAFLMCKGYSGLVLWYDTLLAHSLLDERVAVHGLKALAHKYLGAPDWEKDLKLFLPNKNSSYDLVPDERLYHYAAYDVAFTYQLYERFSEEVNSGIFRSLLMPCANMFSELRHSGLRIDTQFLQELDVVLDDEYQASLDELTERVGRFINPSSSQEVAELVYDELKFPTMGKLGRSTQAKVLAFYQDNPVVRSILDCRQLLKLKSTYVRGVADFVGRDLRIHPFTKLYGTVTGRLSTQDPSIMNITKRRGGGIKKLYIPEDGHLIMEADNKQMELRCFALLANDEFLRNLLQEALTDKMKDPHRLVAFRAFGEEGMESGRRDAKTFVFGRLYGGSAATLSYRLKMPHDKAARLAETVDAMFPKLEEQNQKTIHEIHAQGYVESYFGRRRRFPLLTKEAKHEAYRQGCNFKVQSMASDLNLFCMLHMYEHRKEFGATPLFPVHDSVIFDIENPEVIGPVKLEMEHFTKELVKGQGEFIEEIKYGPNWGEVIDWKE